MSNLKSVYLNNTKVTETDIVVINGLEYEILIKEQYFRKSKDKYGNEVKRETINYAITAVKDSSDLDSNNEQSYLDKLAENLVNICATYPKQITAILNKSLDDYAKSLFVENKDNWDFIPDCNLIDFKLIGDKLLEPTRKGRIITNASLELLANWYKVYSVDVLGKSEKAAHNGSLIIKDNFKQYLTETEVINMFLELFKDVDLSDREIISEENSITLNALINQLDEVIAANEKAKIDIDDL